MKPSPRPVLLALLFAVLAHASADDLDPTRFIGMDLRSAVDSLGLPRDMFTFRGEEETQDNVVFYYSDSLYLFWYRNRVWQVRCDHRFSGSVLGLSLGMSREEVERAFPATLTAVGDSLYFDLQGRSPPMRVRMVFTLKLLSDLYVYRSDF